LPHVQIEIVKGRSLEQRRRLFQAVHDALMEAFEIPTTTTAPRGSSSTSQRTSRSRREFQSLHADRDHRVPRPLRRGEAEPLPGLRPEARRTRHRPDGRLGRNPRAQAGELGRPRRPLRRRDRPGFLARYLNPCGKARRRRTHCHSLARQPVVTQPRLGQLAVEALARPCLTEPRMLASIRAQHVAARGRPPQPRRS
jgi:hypothetical protein